VSSAYRAAASRPLGINFFNLDRRLSFFFSFKYLTG